MQLDGIGLVHDLLDGLVDLLGGGDAGIAQRVVVHILGAHDLGLLQTIGKQLADDRGGGTQSVIFLIDHDNSSYSSFPYLYCACGSNACMTNYYYTSVFFDCQVFIKENGFL